MVKIRTKTVKTTGLKIQNDRFWRAKIPRRTTVRRGESVLRPAAIGAAAAGTKRRAVTGHTENGVLDK